MKFGAPFLGAYAITDPEQIKDYVQRVEDLGYSHLFTDEILLNDDPQNIFHESLTLFAFLAGLTKHLIFVTGIMVLPKRQTILVARQAAEVDVLSQGRLRLGVGVGWKEIEFKSLGVDFHSRGKLIEEQIQIMLALWTNEKVDYHGNFHSFKNTGLNLMPIQRPIPIWIGGVADKVLRRAAKLANGWIADETISEDLEEYIQTLWAYLDDNGKERNAFKIIKYLQMGRVPASEWRELVKYWENIGVTHTVVIPASGWEITNSLASHMEDLKEFSEIMDFF